MLIFVDKLKQNDMKNKEMYLHPEMETLSRPEIEKLQLEEAAADGSSMHALSFL